jgi:hypothetical protein
MKTDYNKAIDKKYTAMIFPDTKSTLNAKKINSNSMAANLNANSKTCK